MAVESSFNHVILTDDDGNVLYANDSVERITGYKKGEILGKTPRLWGQQMDSSFYKKLWKTIKTKKKPFHGEVTNRRKNGDIYYAIATISPVLDDQGKLVGFVGVEEDITEQKKYAEKLEDEVGRRTKQLKTKVKQLTQLKREKDDFIRSASHQLRTPASVIQMQLEILKNEAKMFPKAKHLISELDVLTENNKRAINIMNDLFSIIELGEDYEALRLKKINLKELIGSILDSYEEEIKKRHLKVSASISKSLVIKANEAHIKNALVNLIDNAITYSDQKGKVKIQAKKVGSNVVIDFVDEGIGIPKDEHVKVFTKFFRARNSYIKKTVGTGLGLIIAKTIVEGHSGSVAFRSEEGKGSTFTVKLPV